MGYKCPHCSEDIFGVVPKDRFDTIYQERKTALARVSELEGDLEASKGSATKVEGLQARLERAEAALESERGRFSTYQAISSHGFTDPDLVALTEWQYSRLPAEGRPELAAWLDGLKADPSTAPVALRPHLTAPTAAPEATGAPQGVQGAPQAPATAPTPGNGAGQPQAAPQAPPAANAGARSYSQAPATFSAEAIGRMSPAEYKAHREAILGSLGGK